MLSLCVSRCLYRKCFSRYKMSKKKKTINNKIIVKFCDFHWKSNAHTQFIYFPEQKKKEKLLFSQLFEYKPRKLSPACLYTFAVWPFCIYLLYVRSDIKFFSIGQGWLNKEWRQLSRIFFVCFYIAIEGHMGKIVQIVFS